MGRLEKIMLFIGRLLFTSIYALIFIFNMNTIFNVFIKKMYLESYWYLSGASLLILLNFLLLRIMLIDIPRKIKEVENYACRYSKENKRR